VDVLPVLIPDLPARSITAPWEGAQSSGIPRASALLKKRNLQLIWAFAVVPLHACPCFGLLVTKAFCHVKTHGALGIAQILTLGLKTHLVIRQEVTSLN